MLIFLLTLSLALSYSAADGHTPSHTRLLPKRRKTTTHTHPIHNEQGKHTVKRLPDLSLFSLLVNLGCSLFLGLKCPILGSGVLGSVDCWLFFCVLLLISCLFSLCVCCLFHVCPCSLDVAGRICSNRFEVVVLWIQSFELSLSFSLVVSCGGPSASGRLGPLVCFLSFELNRS